MRRSDRRSWPFSGRTLSRQCLACGALVLLAMSVTSLCLAADPPAISEVALSRPFFNPSLGQRIQISLVAGSPGGWTGRAEAAGEGPVSIAEYGSQKVRIEVQASRESFLVLNDQGSSGWSATVSGSPAPIRTANVLVRAVRVPAGSSTVLFRYRVPGLMEGLLLFAISAVLLFVALAARPRWTWLSPARITSSP